MRILIEGYPYRYEDVKDLVPLDNVWGDVEKSVYMPYVGYYYNPTLGDCVFIYLISNLLQKMSFHQD